MMIFFLLAALLIGLTLSAIHLIWYRKKANLSPNNASNDADWQVMLAKRNEIESDVLIPQQTRSALRNEWIYMADAVLARNQDSDNTSDRRDGSVRNYNTWWILVPATLCALLIYSMTGSWNAEAVKLHLSGHDAGPASNLNLVTTSDADLPVSDNPFHPGSNDSIDKLISQLEKKLKESPDNLDGWILLSRSLATKRDFPGASSALENALKLAPGHPEILADLADMLAMTKNKSLAGRPTELIQEALKNAPDHPKALSLAATAAMQNKDSTLAENYWKRLRATFPPDAPDVAQIDTIIASLSSSGPASPKNDTNSASIQGQVMLSSALRNKLSKTNLPENAMLFIVAKSPSGPAMPLAVARFPAQQLLESNVIPFTLDDSHAMSPSVKLSSQPQVNLEARISMSGTAGKQPGDLFVALPDVKLGAKNLLLEIQSTLMTPK